MSRSQRRRASCEVREALEGMWDEDVCMKRGEHVETKRSGNVRMECGEYLRT